MERFFGYLWIGALLAFGGSSCQKTTESPEAYVQTFLDHLQNQDNEALYRECYISAKADIKKMLLKLGNTTAADPIQVEELYKNLQEEKDHLAKKTPLPLDPNQALTLDSIRSNSRKLEGLGGMIDPPPGVRLEDIDAYLTIGDQSYHVRFYCIDLGDGKWRVARHPVVRRISRK